MSWELHVEGVLDEGFIGFTEEIGRAFILKDRLIRNAGE